jgi:outer membrane lipoprotein-sorting protein
VRRMSTRARWAVPAGAVAVVGIVIGASAVASAAQPSLPARSVAQLLAEVQAGASKPLGPVSATIQQTANLGLPALPQISGLGGDSGALSTIAGTTSVSIWYLDQRHIRIARPVPMGERDLRLDGTQLWLWDSKTQTATHVLLPGQPPKAAPGSHQLAPNVPSESPLAAARQVLKLIGTSTNVTLGPNATVAGRPAYQISISPKGSGSLVSKILIAIDASRHIPLQVQVYARSSASPAYQIGYTALTFGRPAMSNFSFTPPSGAKVKTVKLPATLPPGLARLGPAGLGGLGPLGLATIGQTAIGSTVLPQAPISVGPPCVGSLTIKCTDVRVPASRLAPPTALGKLRAAFIAQLPKGLTPAQRAAAIKKFEARLAELRAGMPGWYGIAPERGLVAPPLPPKTALRQMIAHLPKNMPAAERQAIIRKLRLALAGRAMAANGGGFINLKAGPAAASQGGPTVLGKGWTSVIATPANPAVWAAVQQLLSGKLPAPAINSSLSAVPVLAGSGGPGAQPLPPGASGSQQTGSATFVAGSSTAVATSPGPVGPGLAVLQALLKATTRVHGAWGSGRLLQTTLLSVLIISKGQILAGAVTPSVLYADALSLSR